ncbi:MAG: class I SAM-dependent methyltransferase [Patescibacteria group bacterium]|nr:class I SAM-dependent methyltransferase [Patescibacteria group bacterium]
MYAKPFEIIGWNSIIKKPTKFQVNFEHSYLTYEGVKMPNWRETCVCVRTGLSNRQRLVIQLIHFLGFGDILRSGSVYVTEQLSSFFHFVRSRNGKVVGSEYLGADKKPGVYKDFIRHEDVTNLSFSDSNFDILITNDVLEHLPN